MSLVLIESPNKIPKLRKILGPKYTVMATVGHIMDLSKKNLGIDLDTFDTKYKINADKRDIVKAIKAEAKNHSVIYIATDPDREGEAIAAHIAEILPKRGVTIHRVLFNAITKDVVQKAIKNPGSIDQNLYNAQKARRIKDRLVGFKVSPVMWNKGMIGTSAGRVQSVALKFVADREKEIQSFVPKEYWKIEVDTDLDFKVDFYGINEKQYDISNKKSAYSIVNDVKKEQSPLRVTSYINKSRARKPPPPFVTSTLQQVGSTMFGWSAKKTMQVAQDIFGKGLITYHRTDSTRTDPTKTKEMRDEVERVYGKKYLHSPLRVYGPKGSSQDAHEAIRPTYDNAGASMTKEGKKLLNLIDSRFKASQMPDAQFDQVAVKLKSMNTKKEYNFKVNGSTLKFDGFLKVYGEIKDDVTLPAMSVGDDISWSEIIPSQHFTKPPPRFSDASLIKLLEKEGVGRPSTYASIIDTIMKRKYVEKDGKALSATNIGIMVSDYLTENFSSIVDAGFTATMEARLDNIAEGNVEFADVLKAFYKELSKDIKSATNASFPKSFIVDTKCAKCSNNMVKKISKHGPFLGCIKWPECNGTRSFDGEDSSSEALETGHGCPECSNILVIRKGSNGNFYGCKSYPTCKFSASIGENDEVVIRKKSAAKDTGVKCSRCKKGTMVERSGKYGKFYGCSKYPKCKNIMKTLPK
jgi:DNA topoisomerase-1